MRLPPGVWTSGALVLRSHVTLRLSDGATLRGITPPSVDQIFANYPLYSGRAEAVAGPRAASVSLHHHGDLGDRAPFAVLAAFDHCGGGGRPRRRAVVGVSFFVCFSHRCVGFAASDCVTLARKYSGKKPVGAARPYACDQ